MALVGRPEGHDDSFDRPAPLVFHMSACYHGYIQAAVATDDCAVLNRLVDFPSLHTAVKTDLLQGMEQQYGCSDYPRCQIRWPRGIGDTRCNIVGSSGACVDNVIAWPHTRPSRKK